MSDLEKKRGPILEALCEADTLPPTSVLTTFDDGDAAIAAIKAGAKGLMLKDVSLEIWPGRSGPSPTTRRLFSRR